MIHIPLMNMILFSIPYLLILNRISFIKRFTIKIIITNNYISTNIPILINTNITQSLTGFSNHLITIFGILTNIEKIKFPKHRRIKLFRNIGLRRFTLHYGSSRKRTCGCGLRFTLCCTI